MASIEIKTTDICSSALLSGIPTQIGLNQLGISAIWNLFSKYSNLKCLKKLFCCSNICQTSSSSFCKSTIWTEKNLLVLLTSQINKYKGIDSKELKIINCFYSFVICRRSKTCRLIIFTNHAVGTRTRQ